MANYTRSDRCGKSNEGIFSEVKIRRITISADGVNTGADICGGKDLCKQCQTQLQDFLKPLPQPVPANPRQSEVEDGFGH